MVSFNPRFSETAWGNNVTMSQHLQASSAYFHDHVYVPHTGKTLLWGNDADTIASLLGFLGANFSLENTVRK